MNWISVKKKLPAETAKVLLWLSWARGTRHTFECGFLEDNKWWTDHGPVLGASVTHWVEVKGPKDKRS